MQIKDKVIEKLVNGYIVLIGMVLILLSLFLEGKIENEIIIEFIPISYDIGTSLVSTGIIVYISFKYLQYNKSKSEVLNDWKIDNIYETRAIMNIDTNKELEKNKDELEIIAFGLRGFRDSQTDLIRDKIRKGMKIKILTISPKSKYLEEREKMEKGTTGEISQSIVHLKCWIEELKNDEKYSKQIEIKYYDTLPLDLYFRLDNKVYIGPYLYGKQSQQTISYSFDKGGKVYEYYKNYFYDLWNDKDFCKEDINEL